MKVDKRFAQRYQFTASYALQSQMGLNGIENLDNYDSTWGPQGSLQILHIVGTVQLPWGFSSALISSTSSVGPLMPVVGGIDISGSGAGSTPLPGLSYNCLNSGCGVAHLNAAVANWNTTEAGKLDATGKKIPTLTLPANFSLGRPFNSQDVAADKDVHFPRKVTSSMFSVRCSTCSITLTIADIPSTPVRQPSVNNAARDAGVWIRRPSRRTGRRTIQLLDYLHPLSHSRENLDRPFENLTRMSRRHDRPHPCFSFRDRRKTDASRKKPLFEQRPRKCMTRWPHRQP